MAGQGSPTPGAKQRFSAESKDSTEQQLAMWKGGRKGEKDWPGAQLSALSGHFPAWSGLGLSLASDSILAVSPAWVPRGRRSPELEQEVSSGSHPGPWLHPRRGKEKWKYLPVSCAWQIPAPSLHPQLPGASSHQDMWSQECKTRSDPQGLEGQGRGRVSPQGSTCLCEDSNNICVIPTVRGLLPSQGSSEFSMGSRANSGVPLPLCWDGCRRKRERRRLQIFSPAGRRAWTNRVRSPHPARGLVKQISARAMVSTRWPLSMTSSSCE